MSPGFWDTVLQAVVNGILIGGFYALVGMGLNCIFGVMNIVNFCQGELLMAGMYLTYFMYAYFEVDPYLAAPLVMAVMFAFGGVIQNYLITPFLRRDDADINVLFLTTGLGMLFQNTALIAFGADYRSIRTPYAQDVIHVMNLSISYPKLISLITLLVVTALLFLFFKFTRPGKMIRATAQNQIGARLTGVNIKWIYIAIYGLGAALAGVAGSLLMPFYFVHPMVGATFNLRAFIVVVMGGLGNIRGAFIAGIVLGLMETLGALAAGPAFKDSIVFITFILILIARQRFIMRRTA
ncbi:MAG: branched-chain amino acid ABC transporter permease [Planctomycetota bacterium]|nr:branched-chain amino acid ABC transporter permease [Planctomycetota bacterium]